MMYRSYNHHHEPLLSYDDVRVGTYICVCMYIYIDTCSRAAPGGDGVSDQSITYPASNANGKKIKTARPTLNPVDGGR